MCMNAMHAACSKQQTGSFTVLYTSIVVYVVYGVERKRSAQNYSRLPEDIQKLFEKRPVKMESWPEPLLNNAELLSDKERALASMLIECGQGHLFEKWEAAGKHDAQKHLFFEQVEALDGNYSHSGGIAGYVSNAKVLLQAAQQQKNPLKGWKPEVPHGVELMQPLNEEYNLFESRGMPEIGSVGFVLVAGGLGERLGYPGIKVQLPVDTITGRCYLRHYCEQILAIQTRYVQQQTHGTLLLPLAIMVSEDTADKTLHLLESNAFFGLQREQVTLLKQGKVPALLSNDGHMTSIKESPYVLDAKPHGHGDIHALLYSSGTARAWFEKGVKWVVFFQDTNGLGFLILPAMIGVSVSLDLEVNSLAVPRKAKQAVGAIVKLVSTDDGEKQEGNEQSQKATEMTLNVEYNQLEPLLIATGSPEGDVNDPQTGLSVFPGNINQLLFRMEPYLATLERSRGAMPEFVNPKYADATRTVFKKPTRLECMMQDYPRLLAPRSRVGFTMAPGWFCYSPCKNNAKDAAISIAAGVPAAAPITAESDQCRVYAKLLSLMGASIGGLHGVDNSGPSTDVTILGISASSGPRVLLDPSFAIFPGELRARVPSPQLVKMSTRSTLILKGNVIVDSLDLDGSLSVQVEAEEETAEAIKEYNSSIGYCIHVDTAPSGETGWRNKLKNEGHQLVPLSELTKDESYMSTAPPVTAEDEMRGYRIICHEMTTVCPSSLLPSAIDSVATAVATDVGQPHHKNDNARKITELVYTGVNLVAKT